MSNKLTIKNLHVKIPQKEILKGFNLEIKSGEIHAIMGPNGTGKSTLSQVIMGKKDYDITCGDILFNDESILNLDVSQRARLGIFLAYQYPEEVSGVTNNEFLRTCLKSLTGEDISLFKFITKYDKACKDLKMPDDLPHRYLNQGFSGGEKKRNEILQMKMLKPKIAILDEIDSGLDVDALKIVGTNVYEFAKEQNCGLLLITHYQRLLDYIKPDFVHIMIDGKIVKTGDSKLIERIDKEGYDWIKEEIGYTKEKDDSILLGSCSHAKKFS